MRTLVHSESILATADGFNSKPVDVFKSGDLYCLSGIGSCSNSGSTMNDAYKLVLDNGETLITSTPHLKLEPFYTFVNILSGTNQRYIDNYSKCEKTQRAMIYNHHFMTTERHVIPIDLKLPDSISNLKPVTYTEYVNFLKEHSHKKSGFKFLNEVFTEQYGVTLSYGVNNGMFAGLSNTELVNLCKQYYKSNQHVKSIRSLLKIMLVAGEKVPQSFSKYRFGGDKLGYSNLQRIVFNDEQFSESTPTSLPVALFKLRQFSIDRKNFLKYYSPKVISSEYIGKSLFYNIESESPIAVITKSEDSNYDNCIGVYIC